MFGQRPVVVLDVARRLNKCDGVPLEGIVAVRVVHVFLGEVVKVKVAEAEVKAEEVGAEKAKVSSETEKANVVAEEAEEISVIGEEAEDNQRDRRRGRGQSA